MRLDCCPMTHTSYNFGSVWTSIHSVRIINYSVGFILCLHTTYQSTKMLCHLMYYVYEWKTQNILFFYNLLLILQKSTYNIIFKLSNTNIVYLSRYVHDTRPDVWDVVLQETSYDNYVLNMARSTWHCVTSDVTANVICRSKRHMTTCGTWSITIHVAWQQMAYQNVYQMSLDCRYDVIWQHISCYGWHWMSTDSIHGQAVHLREKAHI